MSDADHAGTDTRSAIPDGVVTRCVACKEVLFAREHERTGRICPHCQHQAPLGAAGRIGFVADTGSFRPVPAAGGAVVGRAAVEGIECAIGAVDGLTEGADGDTANEALAALLALDVPAVLFCAAGVGVVTDAPLGPWRGRAYKALTRHGSARLPYLLVITDAHAEHGLLPSAPLGDIVIAEAAVRDVPAPTQPREGEAADFPFVDMYVPRADIRHELLKLLMFFAQAGDTDGERPD